MIHQLKRRFGSENKTDLRLAGSEAQRVCGVAPASVRFTASAACVIFELLRLQYHQAPEWYLLGHRLGESAAPDDGCKMIDRIRGLSNHEV